MSYMRDCRRFQEQNLPTLRQGNKQETFLMHLQFHKTLFFSQIADCLALKLASEGII